MASFTNHAYANSSSENPPDLYDKAYLERIVIVVRNVLSLIWIEIWKLQPHEESLRLLQESYLLFCRTSMCFTKLNVNHVNLYNPHNARELVGIYEQLLMYYGRITYRNFMSRSEAANEAEALRTGAGQHNTEEFESQVVAEENVNRYQDYIPPGLYSPPAERGTQEAQTQAGPPENQVEDSQNGTNYNLYDEEWPPLPSI